MAVDINNLGSFSSINAVWARYPEGGHEGDYLTISGVKYRWNKYLRIWENASTVTPTPARLVQTIGGDLTVNNDTIIGDELKVRGDTYLEGDVKVEGMLDAKAVKQPNRGFFQTAQALQDAYPSPEVGWWATVGDVMPGTVYRCQTEGVWTNTGQTGGVDTERVYFEIEDSLTSISTDKALSANMGKQLEMTKAGYAQFASYSCATSSSTVAKKVNNATGFVLDTGSLMKVTFADDNSASDPTMNVNSTGNYPLYYNGSPASSLNTWKSGDIVWLFFDGTNYQAYPISSDDVPTINSLKPAKSNGIFQEIHSSDVPLIRQMAYLSGGRFELKNWETGSLNTSSLSVGDTVDINNDFTSGANLIHILIDVEINERIRISKLYFHAKNTASYKNWIFLDSDYKVVQLANSSSSYTGTLTPSNETRYVLINCNISESYGVSDYFVYIDKTNEVLNDSFSIYADETSSIINPIIGEEATLTNWKRGQYNTSELNVGDTLDLNSLSASNLHMLIDLKLTDKIRIKTLYYHVKNTASYKNWIMLDEEYKVLSIANLDAEWTGSLSPSSSVRYVIFNCNNNSTYGISDYFVKILETSKVWINTYERGSILEPFEVTGLGTYIHEDGSINEPTGTTYNVVAKYDISKYTERQDFALLAFVANFRTIRNLYGVGYYGENGECLGVDHAAAANTIFQNEILQVPGLTKYIYLQTNTTYPEANSLSVLNAYEAAVARKERSDAAKTGVKVLMIGNSWARDMMRYVAATFKTLGYDVIVGQPYLGGSTLQDQYYGIDDVDYAYNHSGNMQKVHSTYQYWKYSNMANPSKDPASGYNNGAAGIGVTLQHCVEDEPWDYIVFLPSASNAGSYDSFTEYDKVNYKIDIKDFVSKVKEWCTNPNVKFGWAIPWSYAEGTTATISQLFADTYNNGVIPSTQADKNDLFERAHAQMQEVGLLIGEYMADDCSFILNPGLAVYNGRHHSGLLKYGFKLQRSANNTHLGSGIPMYLAGLTCVYELREVDRRAIEYYPLDSSESVDGDTGDTDETIDPTAYIADQTKRMAFYAQVNNQTYIGT